MICRFLKILGCVLIVGMVFIAGGSAQSSVHPSGEEFLFLCNATTGDDDGDARFTRCEKFVRKTRDALLKASVHGVRACIPNETSDLKLVFTAINWLEDNSVEDDTEADEVLALAFAEIWPCSKGS